ncbi:hypothetical protein ACLKA6_002989 [Drosophila palustris]
MDYETKRRALAVSNLAISGALAVYYIAKKKEENAAKARKNKRSSTWVNPYLQERRIKGRYAVSFQNMTQTPKVFAENFHMSEANFNYLFSLVEPFLQPKKNSRPDAIPLKAKLCVVLEMLASGSLQRHFASSYRISKQHMGVTIDLVCDAICAGLSGEFPKWTKQSMLKWAEDFETKWNFPNCIGAIDGKHVPIKSPPNSGSAFYNYKGFHSIVLMAQVDDSAKYPT